MDALLDAARDHLRQTIDLKPAECDVTPDGQPNPMAGQRFVAVHPGAVQNAQVHCLDERYSFKVTVTCRTAQDPRDRKRDGGAWKLAEKVRAAIHMSYALTALATETDPNVVFTEPPCYESGNSLGPRDASWFWSDRDTDTGFAVELSFGRARRIQYIEEQE
jgi:hypothetical protein